MATVLLVEDTAMQVTLLTSFLDPDHQVVGTAGDAELAVELATEHRPDIVVMDLNLEGGSGIDATERITSLDDSIAVVVSTVHVGQDTIEAAMAAGADDYLCKPYSQAELLETIETVLA